MGRLEAVAWTADDLEGGVAARFARVVSRCGDRVAVRDGASALTYAALDALATWIARAVRERAAGTVGLLLAHGPVVPAAALGAAKAGVPWVQLHPDHPPERNAFVLDDAEVTVLLTDAAHADRARALAGRVPRRIDVVVVRPDARAAAVVASPPADVACLRYTSGSTGRPKGVCLPPQAILHAAMDFAREAALRGDDRVSALSAGIGATEIHAPLLTGATLLPFDVRGRGIEALARWVVDERLTCLRVVPTVFRRLVQALGDGPPLAHLRLVRFHGEAVTRADWEAFRAVTRPGAELIVGLGSTEALAVRAGRFAWDADPAPGVLPLTVEVPGKLVRVCDDAGRPVGLGAVGEVVVHSAYLFSGYWRQPDLTAAVLRADPDDARRRVFRTGDLVRVEPGGALVPVGRVDQQVKVAGNRIEIAEVEQALRGASGVRDAVIVPRARRDGGVRLVGVCVVDGALPPRGVLRAHLLARLPAPMVPSAFVAMERLPLLPSGKVDRRAVAAALGPEAPAHVPPRNAMEETVAELWQRVLGCDRVGMDDDLFHDLGGDSLAAVAILAAVEEVCGRTLPLDVFHDAPTPGALAARIADATWVPPPDGRLVVHADGTRPPVFAVCGAFGHALRLLLIGRALDPDQPFVGLQPPGMDWASAGCGTIEAMAAHYAATIRAMRPHGPYRLLGTSLGGLLAFEIAVALQRAGQVVDLLVMVDTAFPQRVAAGDEPQGPRVDFTDGVDAGDRLVAMGLTVARQHRAALDAYVLRRRFDGRILYLRCDEPPVPPATDRRRRWRRWATDGAHVVTVPGRHGTFHQEPQRGAVVRALREALDGLPVREPCSLPPARASGSASSPG